MIPRVLQEEMADRAGAHVSTLQAGHLSLITHPGDVTKVILSAVNATTGSETLEAATASAVGS